MRRSRSYGEPPGEEPGGGRRAKKAAKKRRWVPPPGGGSGSAPPPPSSGRRGRPQGWASPEEWDDDRYEPEPPRRSTPTRRYDDRGYDYYEDRRDPYQDEYERGYQRGYERGHDRAHDRRRPRPRPRYDERYDDRAYDDRAYDDRDLYEERRPPRAPHGDPVAPGYGRLPDYGTGTAGEPPPGSPGGPKIPRKITVTRVAAFRSKQAVRKGAKAFISATNADGADRSGLNRLIYAWMANHAADAALAVALANTLFFAAASAEGKEKVALYLLITVAPFALIAPVIGPMLDRMQRGRRLLMAVSFVLRAVLCIVMAGHLEDWLLYPAALGFMVLSKSFNVIKAAAVPRVLPPDITLTKTNSRLAIFGLVAMLAAGGFAGALAFPFGSEGALVFNVGVCIAGAYLCLQIPRWVENTGEEEVPATLRSDPVDEYETRRGRQPMGRHVVVALWGNGTTKWLSGFLTLFVAFTVKDQSGGSATQQAVQLGLFGAAAGVGVALGNAVGARMSFKRPDQIVAICVAMNLGACVVAVIMPGIATAGLCGLVGAVATSLAKVCIDAVIQRDIPEASRASAFGRSETVLQLSWVFGGAFGVMLPTEWWVGFLVAAIVMGLGLIQTILARRGGSLLPGVGGDRPLRPDPIPRRSGKRFGRKKGGYPQGAGLYPAGEGGPYDK